MAVTSLRYRITLPTLLFRTHGHPPTLNLSAPHTTPPTPIFTPVVEPIHKNLLATLPLWTPQCLFAWRYLALHLASWGLVPKTKKDVSDCAVWHPYGIGHRAKILRIRFHWWKCFNNLNAFKEFIELIKWYGSLKKTATQQFLLGEKNCNLHILLQTARK